MTAYAHSSEDDDPFDGLSLHSLQPDDYNTDGWVVTLTVPDNATMRRVLERWGPR